MSAVEAIVKFLVYAAGISLWCLVIACVLTLAGTWLRAKAAAPLTRLGVLRPRTRRPRAPVDGEDAAWLAQMGPGLKDPPAEATRNKLFTSEDESDRP